MAGKILLTGDTHGEFCRFNVNRFYEQGNLDKEDYVVICGDFGLIWDRYRKSIFDREEDMEGATWESEKERWWLDWLESKTFTVLFVDGNHENFDRLNAYPVEVWNGGKVHKIRSSVIHLMRGQVYEIAGKRIFTFGGARSADIQGGVLDPKDPQYYEKKHALDSEYINYRTNHVSWWKEEMPSKEEMEEGIKNLAQYENEVDYIITHCGPRVLQDKILGKEVVIHEENAIIDYFDYIRDNVKYDKWYMGHYHRDEDVTEKETVLYHGIIRIGDGANTMVPKLGEPRYEIGQAVKFFVKGQKIVGIIGSCDKFGCVSVPDEPSYDIWGEYETQCTLFKHFSETEVKALTKQEEKSNKDLLERLRTR